MNEPDTINLDDTGEVRLLDMPARVELADGKPRLLPAASGKWLAVLARNIGKPGLRLVLLRAKQRRSSPANRYLWGVVYEDYFEGMKALAIECGMEPPFRSKEDLHIWAKWKYLREKVVLPGGEIEEVPGSTRCSAERFYWFIAQLKQGAQERHIYIREPNEEVSL